MKHIYICVGIFFSLALSRFIPHPPNFTSLLALSFYVPAILGIRYLPFLLISFAITDFIIGYHTGTHWTWGSVLVIGFISQYFVKNISYRLSGALLGALIFFLITNFGVWVSGMYGYTFSGLVSCYVLAIPFFSYSLISTFIFSSLIEAVLYFIKQKKINYSSN
ncbi:MAG: hypothetical protein CMI71_02385 [Candidatus Pelagibacter sp.]|nr:hypothetical protein [Candidatus Pelagibacter sp.]MAV05826.1 hypothetical protein [Candidatus Pelagibacter sp.]RPG11799.1 MAG: hypothetical protein CBD30_000585 [Pelagibacteraceae bacterium TMED170]|tara:strand:- start:7749 stop:8240 length:492 start_codon:yes stop_codon:yes gene_type:complete